MWKEAIKLMQEMPNSIEEANYIIAQSNYYLGDLSAAKMALQSLNLETAIKFSTFAKKLNLLDSTKELANTLYKTEKFKDALDLYTKALAIDSENLVVNTIL